jgi:hypothetical protein
MANPTYQSGFYAPGRGTALHPELWRGCVGAWNPGLGNTGLALRDWSGNQNNGTLIGGPTWGVSDGRQALDFDGVDDYVVISPVSLGTVYTASFWMYSTVSDKVTIAGGFTPQHYVLYPATAGWYHQAEGSYCLFNTISQASWLNKWTHVTIRRKGTTTVDAFFNGVLKQTATLSGANSSLAVNRIGSFDGSSSYNYNGKMTGIHLYNRALSPQEIRTLAQRPGIAYERAPRKFYSLPAAASSRQYRLFRPSILRGA